MDRSIKYGIMVLLLIGAGAAVFFMNEEGEYDRQPKETNVDMINWEKDYDSHSNHPFGTYFLHELIDRGLDGFRLHNMDHSVQAYFDHDSLKIQEDRLTYMFIGTNLSLYADEVDSLLKFAQEGNSLFLSAEHFPVRLLEELLSYNYNNNFIELRDTSVFLAFNQNQFSGLEFELSNTVNQKKTERKWRTWSKNMYSSYGMQILGSADEKTCYVKFSYGEGSVLLHTIPQVFTNQFLKTKEGRDYIEKSLSYLPKSIVLWDDYTQFVSSAGDFELDNSTSQRYSSKGGRVNTDSTIAFLLKSKSLRWAYFIILALLVLFVVFMGKRRQKIIPTIKPNNNTSLEFTETISRIYLLQGQHNKLIKHMEIIFRNKIKTRYYIAYVDDEHYADRIAKKSGVDLAEVNHILKMFQQGSQEIEISELFLVELYKALQDFYKKAH